MISRTLNKFLRLEAAGSILLLLATILALIINNSVLAHYYNYLLEVPFRIGLGAFELDKPLLLWINDGLMAIFFFLVGLELKRELLDGELSQPSRIVLPIVGAVGGMAVPALLYVLLNADNSVALQGWAIPAATDIAFAIGAFSAFGSRLPSSLKIFLLSLAIIDDLGAIVIIAVFYSQDLSLISLVAALIIMFFLFLLNRRGVIRIAPYIVLGILLWLAVLKSGVHATLAGVVLAFFIPFGAKTEEGDSPLKHLEHLLHPYVAFAILPIFAFANAGISFAGLSLDFLLNPITLGIVLGLLVGKQVGIFLPVWLTTRLGLAERPQNANWGQIYGVSILCGIGFTMSLFIGSLAFEHTGVDLNTPVRFGIIVGSALSALLGLSVLYLSRNKNSEHSK